MYYVDANRCRGCELCVQACPVGAIRLVAGKAEIDPNRCQECGACAEVCPMQAILSVTEPERATEPQKAIGERQVSIEPVAPQGVTTSRPIVPQTWARRVASWTPILASVVRVVGPRLWNFIGGVGRSGRRTAGIGRGTGFGWRRRRWRGPHW